MKVKAVIFDLDDTLYDCTGSLIEASRRRAAKSMVEAGLPCTEDEAYQLQKELAEKHGPYHPVFNEIVNRFHADPKLVSTAYKAYNSSEVVGIKPFSDVIPTLKELRETDYKVKRIFQIPTILQLRNMDKTPDKLKILAIGGCTGLPIMLEGSKTYSKHI